MLRAMSMASGLVFLTITTLLAETPIAGLGPIGEVEQIQTDFQFTEGPAKAPDGTIYFTDIPANRIYQLSTEGKMTVFLEPSGHCNGLMVTADGTLYACSMDGQVIKIDRSTKQVTPLASEYQGKRFNAPNDLVIDQSGGIYFTDPHYRAPDPLPQKTTAVYYRSPEGKVTRLLDDLNAPNGVILSPDEDTLYVIPSQQSEMMAYPVKAPGKLGTGKVFCHLKQKAGQTGRGGDGLTVDTQGNLYITSALGLQVYSPQGKLLGVVEFPEQPANVTFAGEDNNHLYVTARKSLYMVKMKATGHQFPGPAK